MKKVFIIAGEASGDLYAKEIIKKLQNNNIEVFAMGSKNVQETQAKIIQDSTELSVTGIIEVVKVYSKIKKALDNIQKNLLIKKPDLLILIDYQEFNFRLAKFAKANGIKVLFFIGPQFWAWRPKRIKKFKNIVDKMAVIFPFEEEPYKQLGIDVSYVGHPLINLDTSFKGIKKKVNKDSFTIGFFPGSRMNEIKRLSPIFDKVISNLNSNNFNFFVSASSKRFEKFFKNYKNCEVVYNENIYDSINRCDIAVAASGTITLQIALCEKPLCVIYKLSWLSYLFAKFLVKLKDISLVNIICNKSIVKEFIQHEVTSTNIAKEITRIAEDDQYRSIICKELKDIKEILKKENGENIVDIIFQMIE